MGKFWYIIHNMLAHPLLITGTKWADRFHDWTANKIVDKLEVAIAPRRGTMSELKMYSYHYRIGPHKIIEQHEHRTIIFEIQGLNWLSKRRLNRVKAFYDTIDTQWRPFNTTFKVINSKTKKSIV